MLIVENFDELSYFCEFDSSFCAGKQCYTTTKNIVMVLTDLLAIDVKPKSVAQVYLTAHDYINHVETFTEILHH